MKSLSSVIKKITSNPKLSNKLNNIKVIEIWEGIVGENLIKYIIDSKVYKQVLYVKLKSSAMRNEYIYKKSEIISEINNRFGRVIIKDIKFK
tara:strand:+ start:2131 stop:2406 length:276 start_codon:yes stop_codon:yes gene_type:complete